MPRKIPVQSDAQPGRTGSRAQYRGLSKVDSLVWSEFLRLYGNSLDNVAYNVAVGQWVPPNREQLIVATRIPSELLAKRIDAVGYWSGTWTMFEVKPRINPSAIGQCQVYLAGWRYTYPDFPVPVPVIVYALQDVDCERAALAANIRTVQMRMPPELFVDYGYKL